MVGEGLSDRLRRGEHRAKIRDESGGQFLSRHLHLLFTTLHRSEPVLESGILPSLACGYCPALCPTSYRLVSFRSYMGSLFTLLMHHCPKLPFVSYLFIALVAPLWLHPPYCVFSMSCTASWTGSPVACSELIRRFILFCPFPPPSFYACSILSYV